ncbi:hypothetical protein J4Q44_G00394450, partial [Coregonus suidteri]
VISCFVHRNQQERSESEILSGQSSQSHQTDLASIFSLLEENIMTFVKNQLNMFKRILSPELPEGFESQKQDKEVEDAEDEKQESSAREGGSEDHTARPEENEPEGAC